MEKIEASNSPRCGTNRAPQNKTDKVNAHDNNANMPDYYMSSINRAADRKTSKVSASRMCSKFSDIYFSYIGCFEGTFSIQLKDGS